MARNPPQPPLIRGEKRWRTGRICVRSVLWIEGAGDCLESPPAPLDKGGEEARQVEFSMLTIKVEFDIVVNVISNSFRIFWVPQEEKS